MICPNCEVRPKQTHWNSKWCQPCAADRRRSPRSKLAPWQKQKALRLRGKLPVGEIAERLRTSRSDLIRYGREQGLSWAHAAGSRKYQMRPGFIRLVCDYYAKHGKQKTADAFPGIRVRSIIERYPHASRQDRWTNEQLRELAQMAGLVSMSAQARYFARPRANEGSIKSAFMKRFGQGGGMINGLSWHIARHLVGPRCRPIRTAYWQTRYPGRKGIQARRIVLWCDLERHLRPEVPNEIRHALRAAARIQRWLHGVEHVRPRVIRLINERESHGK